MRVSGLIAAVLLLCAAAAGADTAKVERGWGRGKYGEGDEEGDGREGKEKGKV